MDLFRAAQGWVAVKRPTLTSAAHPAMTKLGTLISYLTKFQNIYKSRQIP